MRRLFLFLLLAAGASTGSQVAALSEEAIMRCAQIAHEKILQENPASARAHRAYAEFLSDHGNLRAAIVHWRQAQQIEPNNAATANSLGGAYLRIGCAAESADQFNRAVGLESGNAAYHFNLANVEFMLRHELTVAWKVDSSEVLRRALAEFYLASQLSPNDLEYARAYAETFYSVPDPDWVTAESAWKHVLELSPQGDFAYLQLARINLKRGDASGAHRCLNKLTDARTDSLKRKLLEQAERL